MCAIIFGTLTTSPSLAQDTQAITIDPAALSVDEDSEETYTVALAAVPTGPVTVTVSGHSGTDLSLSTSSLTFTTINWEAAQAVTVTTVDDDDAVNDTVTLAHAATGGGYDGISASMTVTIQDDERGLVTNRPTLFMTEGDREEYGIGLATRPTGPVTVTVSAPPGRLGEDVSVAPASLTFSTTNWSVFQTFTVTALEERDGIDEYLILKNSASGGGYDGVESEIFLGVTDDDKGVAVSPTTLTVDEGGDGEYTLALKAEPSAKVRVRVRPHSILGTDVRVNPGEVSFTPSNWETAQTVTVTAVEDDDAVNDKVTVAHVTFGIGYSRLPVDSVTVTVEDDDTAGVTVNPTALTVDEGGNGEYTVELATQPTGPVTVTVSGHSGTDVSPSKTSLTFSTTNWAAAQTVTVTAAEDDEDSVNDEVTLAHMASGGSYDGISTDIEITVRDNERGLEIAPQALFITEGGNEKYTVELATQPSGTVTVTISGHAGTDLSLNRTSLTFTELSWHAAQTVTVTTSVDDDGIDEYVKLDLSASGGGYDGVVSEINVSVNDADKRVTVSPTALMVDEDGSGEYTMALAAEPSGPVTVTVSVPAGADLSLSTSSLTFSTSNWETAQMVTVTAEDDDDAINDTVTVTHAAAGAGYFGVLISSVTVTIADDERGMTVSPTELTIDKNDDGEYTVELDTAPTGPVTVTVSGHSGTDLSVSPESLIFTPMTWETAQTVTVTAGRDRDAVDDTVTLMHTASGGGYDGVGTGMTVTVTDSDESNVTVNPTALEIDEEDDGEYTVVLAIQPSGPVTVAVSGHAGTDLSLSTSSLTFTTANWHVAQTVTVTAEDDDDAVNDNITLRHLASGTGFDGNVTDMAVTIRDDERGVTVTPTELTIEEDSDGRYTVVLNAEPAGNVTVEMASDNSDVSLDRTRLEFTTKNWETAQTVTVRVADDTDAMNERAEVTHTVSGGGYDGLGAQAVTVSVHDDERGVTTNVPFLLLDESAQDTYTIVLATQPSGTVTVAVSGFVGTSVAVLTSVFEFTTMNWNTAQTVTVVASGDGDGIDEYVKLDLSASGGGYDGVVSEVGVFVNDNDKKVVVSPTELTVDEGGDGEYTLALTAQPRSTVTVFAHGVLGTDVRLSRQQVLFTPSNWQMVQTVTVMAEEDDDAVNDTVTVTHAAIGAGYFGIPIGSVTVTVADDERGVTVSPTELEIDEGGDGEYTVVLDALPSGPVTVTASGHSGTDLSLNKTRLTFTTGNWETAQTVTVTAAEDDADAVDDEVTLTHAVSGGGYAGVEVNDVVVTVDDNERGVTVSPTALTVSEGGSGEYTVALAIQPSGPVTVAVSGHTGTDVALSTSSLTFTTANWETAQTVTVLAMTDADAVNDEVTLAHAATGGGYKGVMIYDVKVKVDDVQNGITINPSSFRIDEDGDGEYTVVLDARPTGPVTVAVSGHAGTDVSVNPASLTFTPMTWETVQTVTVMAEDDEDRANDFVLLMHTATGGGYSGETVDDVRVTVDENDREIVVRPNPLTVDEGDDGEYTVVLVGEPSGSVTVTVSGHSGTDVSLSASSLTFTTANWGTAQTVTVTAEEDDDDAVNDVVTLTHTGSGGGYEGRSTSMTVKVADDERGVTVSPTALTVDEEDAGEYTVVLDARPSGSVTVTVSAPADADLSLSTSSLTFTTANWETAQTVTVTAKDDDDAVNDVVTLAHAVSGGSYYGVTIADVQVTVQDNERGVTIDPLSLFVAEGGRGEYTVALDAAPTGPVTVSVSGHTDPDLVVNPTRLTFTPSSWEMAQTVTVLPREDGDGISQKVRLRHAVWGSSYTGVGFLFAVVTAVDDDREVRVHPTELEIDEGDDGEYTVVLGAEPAGPVTVTVSGHSGTDVSLSTSSLTFTTANWETVQTVTVTAAEDDDDAVNDVVTLAHAASGGDYDGVTATVTVTVADDEREVITNYSIFTLDEGSSGEYTVALAAEPAGPVTVTLSGHSGTDVSLSTSSLTFTTGNWGTAQTVTVTAAEDDADAVIDTVFISLAVSGGGYDGVFAPPLVVIVYDNERGVTVSPTELEIDEGGDGEYTLVLDTLPTEAVTVAVTVPAAADLSLNKRRLTFTTANWGTAQTVTVTARRDDDGADEMVELRHRVSARTGEGYDGVAIASVTVSVEDTDRGLVVPAALTVAEGGSGEYTVALAAEPSGPVTVTVSGHSGTDVSLNASSLTFTTGNWETAQTVTVTAAEDDADAVNDVVTLAHAASGGDYGGVTAALTVTVADNERGVTVSPTELEIDEGGDGEYTVVLDALPSGSVTVSVTVPAGADLSLNKTSLTFTTGNWETAQTVTVTAERDDDGADEMVTLAHAVSGGGYAGVTAAGVTVSVEDADRGLVVPAALTVAEGGSGEYTVALAAEPSGPVTVTVSGHSGTDVSLNASSLTFTTGNWETAQTVTVTAAEDDADAVNDVVTLAHAASGGDYGGVTAALTVTVADNERGVTVSPTELEIDEGGDGEYTVVLDALPSGSVTVSVTVPADADLSLNKTSLTFTTGNWETVQTVTVTAERDDDGADEMVTLAHAVSGGGYAGVTAAGVTVSVEDADRGLVVPAALTVAEGGSGEYTVALAAEPSGPVTVTVSGHSGTDVSLNASSLTFTTTTWETAQTVTVTAAEDDADAVNDVVTLAHAASGGDYGGVTAALTVTVADNERGVTVSPTELEIDEGGDGEYTVVLDALPSGPVTVSVTVPAGADLSLNKTSLTFTTGNWETAQTVTVTAERDDDGVDEMVTLSHAVSGGGYAGVTAAGVTVSVEDTDRGLVVPAALTVRRGRQRRVHGGAGGGAVGAGDGDGVGAFGDGRVAEREQPDVHHRELGDGADGDGDGGGGRRRRGERRGDPGARGVRRRLRRGDGGADGDGGGQRARGDGEPDRAGDRRGRRRRVHGGAGRAAERVGDGVGDGARRRRPVAEQDEPDVHHRELGDGADGDGDGGAGRRRGGRDGDAGARGVGRRLRRGDGGRRDGVGGRRRPRAGGAGRADGRRGRQRRVHGGAGGGAVGAGDGDGVGAFGDGRVAEREQPDLHHHDLGDGADG